MKKLLVACCVVTALVAVAATSAASPPIIGTPLGVGTLAAPFTLSGKAGFTRTTIEVPDADDNKLRLSSVIIIQRAEQVAADEKKDNPLRFDQIKIYPSYGDPFRKAVAKQMGFFFTVYPAKSVAAAPEVTLEVVKSAKSLVKVPLKTPAPDASGRIQTWQPSPQGLREQLRQVNTRRARSSERLGIDLNSNTLAHCEILYLEPLIR